MVDFGLTCTQFLISYYHCPGLLLLSIDHLFIMSIPCKHQNAVPPKTSPKDIAVRIRAEVWVPCVDWSASDSNIRISMPPEHTAFNLIPDLAHSRAAFLVRSMTLCLVATYGDEPGKPISPAIDAKLTMVPACF